MYELLTIGPDATYRNPIPSAISLYASNASGVTYSATGRCRFVGRMYCPNVTTSTPASLSFSSASTTCALVSPNPNMRLVFVISAPAAFAVFRTSTLCAQFARRSRTCAWSSGTVSTLCAKTSRPLDATRATNARSPRKSGASASTSTSGASRFKCAIVAAMCPAP